MRWPSLSSGLADHVRVLVASLGRLAAHPLSTVMTVAVIGIALALPAGLQLLVTNARLLSGHWEGAAELSVYLKDDVDLATARNLADTLAEDPDIAEVRLIPADEALAEFREYSGFGAALDVLEDNPLPHVLVLLPADRGASPEVLEGLRDRLAESLPADQVQADTAWVARLQAMLELARRMALLAGLLLALGVIIIVGNTIRLDIQNRRDEIEVTKLIGATDAFIRRPFLYTGVWYGLVGGLIALALVSLSVVALDEPVRRLSGLYGSPFRLIGPGARGGVLLAGLGVVLGWLGSWVSATRSMRHIEPGGKQ
jgi:cell division transport system permease protein